MQLLSVLILAITREVYGQIGPAQQFPSIDPNHYGADGNPCYDREGNPQRCVPDFINAAFNLEVDVTNTCGVREPTKFCVQTGHAGLRSVCETCDSRHPSYAHPAKYLTDFNNANNETWWQSETMKEGTQFPNSVNFTLTLGKSFDITYVRLKFISPRPESFAIYKKTTLDDDWQPWQYYSGSCRATYQKSDKAPILPGNEAVAQCTKEFSDISPITGGNIAFSTLEGRPSAHAFEDSNVLQEWVTATAIRVVFNRMNTFGDEVFGDPQVLQSYYYAVSDFAVGGRCKCNGHASECVPSTGQEGEKRLVCRCEHNTEGADCNQCKSNYNDRPWRPATSVEANECIACNCSDLASTCFFDEKLFNVTGHGGHCLNCQGNTQGVHCEKCMENHWRQPGNNYCVPCACSSVGSTSEQCDENGQCSCKPGVTGRHCDQCQNGFYDFGPNGCTDCGCAIHGSFNNQPLCDPTSGACTCKMNVEGRQCSACKPGYFDLSADNDFGCTPCFCYGHSSICSSSENYFAANITTNFEHDKMNWQGMVENRPVDAQWAELDKAVAVSDPGAGKIVYFVAPSAFTGDQRSSYNQDLKFTLRVNHDGAHASHKDVVLVGSGGQELTIPIFAQDNPIPATFPQQYSFRIHADSSFQWQPRLYELDFIGILSNITALMIRGTYSPNDIGFLSDVSLGTAASFGMIAHDPKPATWVETCQCMDGFVGQFCESCAPGYKRENKFGGPFNRCIKCDCHSHSDSCDANSGACICEHNTDGDTCERCARGFFGNALAGTADDCQECPCPEGGACVLHSDGEVLCTECPVGYTGRRCDECQDGFFGNPKENTPCNECQCNGNIDTNSIGNCDKVSGECKKCVFNTVGHHCEMCKPGFWGDALAEPKGDCKACQCYAAGTRRPNNDYETLECNQESGQCDCLPNIIGAKCDECQHGYYNITSGHGCESCGCDALGSVDEACDLVTGQCKCKAGVTGKKCDQCAPLFYGFSDEGCKACDCEVMGSENAQCDVTTGQCLCRNNVEGRRCDQCAENRFNLRAGCLPCDDCYSLIQMRVNSFRGAVTSLDNTLREIIENPAPVDDSEFQAKVTSVEAEVTALTKEVQQALEADESVLVSKVAALKKDVSDAIQHIKEVDGYVNTARNNGREADQSLDRWRILHDQAKDELEKAIQYLEIEGKTQYEKAQQAAKTYGDQNEQMTRLAEKTREEAEAQEKKSKEIEKMANEARDAAKNAHAEARDAIFGGESVSKQIGQLKIKEIELNQTLARVLELAEDQKKAAVTANEAAAEALTMVEGLRLPDVNPTKLREEAERLAEEARNTKSNAEQESINNKKTLEEAERARAEADSDLQAAMDQQKVSDGLLTDIDAAREKAENAQKLADQTLQEAEQTLKTLQEFNDRVEKSKELALQELTKLAEIEEIIKKSETATNNARVAIGSAKDEADQSKQKATEAEENANKISQEAGKLRNATNQMKEAAAALRKEASNLNEDLEKTDAKMIDYNAQAKDDRQLTTEAVRKASLAQKSAMEAENATKTELDRVKKILDRLNAIDDVNNQELDELEKMCNDAEEWLNVPDREKELTRMREEKAKMDKGLHDIKLDLEYLKKEVETMEFIAEKLPADCFNPVALEQEGQR